MESRNTNTSVFKAIDYPTVFIYLFFVIFGAVSIYAASYDFDNASLFDFSEYSGKQFMWIGISLFAACCLLLIDIRAYEAYSYLIYAVIILLLIVTIFIAPDIKGSRSWIVMGPVSLQPAEFAKSATALALAKLFSSYNFKLNASAKNYFLAFFIILTPIVLIKLQHETGSALVYLSLIFVLYREGMSGLTLLAVFLSVLYFVIGIKYSDSMIMSITTGEFSVFVIIMAVFVGLLHIYCKSQILARNVFFGYLAAGILAYAVSLFGITINGYAFFISAIVVSLIYVIIFLHRENIKKVFISVTATVLSVIFLFSVNLVFSKLEPHQQQRIKVNFGMVDDLRNAGYNVNQSKIAIGSGGAFGKGFLNGTQTKLKYVPEQHTDFIFCTIGEEEGFVGSAVVILTFLALILRIIIIAERQPSAFGRVYGYCVAS